jgi:hypothetical protein
MTKNTTKKAGRGRPSIPVSFGFTRGRSFTLDSVLKHYPKISRATAYNKLQAEIRGRRAHEIKAERTPQEGQGHPTYRYQIRKPKTVAAPVAA